MAKGDKGNRGSVAATNVEPQGEQRAPEQGISTDLEATSPGAGVEAPQAPAEPQDEPGPEDFDRHSGARLVSDHEADKALLDQIQRRIEKREEVIGNRLRSKGAHATIRIGGAEYVARAKPNSGGKMGLAKVGPRVETSIDL